MHLHTPLVTVITSYYNDEEFIAQAIRSVLQQTYPHWEYILINHHTADKSRQIARSFKDPRIKHIDLPQNYGASGNILVKKGLEQAHGTYIKLLCADDILKPNALELLVNQAQKTQADLVFGDIAFVNKRQETLRKTWFSSRFKPNLPLHKYVQAFLQGTSCLPYAGNLIKKSSLDNISPDYICVNLADMNLWISLLLKGGKLAFVNQPVCDYRLHAGNMCSITQATTIHTRNFFEHLLFMQHIVNTTPPLALLKQLFPTDKFISALTPADKALIPFAFAHALEQTSSVAAFKQACRLKMAEMLNNYSVQQAVEKKFRYSIKNLREKLLSQPLQTAAVNRFSSAQQDFKTARLGTLSYFWFRKCFHIILLRDYRHRKKQKQATPNAPEFEEVI